jgi:formamidopyrimidine-DNA glycosylase
MPELPEVESVVRTLRPILIGATIKTVDVFHSKMVSPKPTNFIESLIGKSFVRIERIGKFILFFLTENLVVVSHLRMEGKYYELVDEHAPLTRFARLVFSLQDGRRIVYDDMRKFGTFHLSTSATYRQLKSIKQLGIEPMDVSDIPSVHQAFSSSTRTIKNLLLDQTILLGLGNIYADEVLFATKIHPLIKGNQLTLEQSTQIIHESKRILTAAIQAGGTRIRSYRSGGEIDGHFTLSILAYGQEGKPCPRCHHRIDKISVSGRGTHYCPRCQHHPDFPFVIGVTGEIATGKTTLVELARQQGISSIVADEIVHKLYQQPPIIK